jgi:hypothetical protein
VSEESMNVKMEKIHHRLIQIKNGLGFHVDNEDSRKMIILCDLMISINNSVVNELHTSRSWGVDDRKGFKGFVIQVEDFIRLNCELLLPSHI